MRETSKSLRRRWCEHELGVFPWRDIFKGFGLDVGAGDDPLPFDNCTHFDKQDGDANHLSEYFAGHEGMMNGRPFDYIYASQVLEHLHDPAACVRDWVTLVRPGGHLIVTVPDWVAYEGMRWPSPWNGDHKATFSMIYRGSKAPVHIHIPTMLDSLGDVAEVRLARFVDFNYDYAVGTSRDQTFDELACVECWNEWVLQKK